MSARPTTVVKVGGSLTKSNESNAAASLMRDLVARRRERFIVVPGGGEFADAVRLAQRRHALGEDAAHHMALLAMHMSAVMLAALGNGSEGRHGLLRNSLVRAAQDPHATKSADDIRSPCAIVAERSEEFDSAWERKVLPIWAPERMVLSARAVPASWEVTSDSLAAWLTSQIGAARLLVVKSCMVPEEMRGDAAALAAAGIVDASFPKFVIAAAFSWQVVGGADAAMRALDA